MMLAFAVIFYDRCVVCSLLLVCTMFASLVRDSFFREFSSSVSQIRITRQVLPRIGNFDSAFLSYVPPTVLPIRLLCPPGLSSSSSRCFLKTSILGSFRTFEWENSCVHSSSFCELEMPFVSSSCASYGHESGTLDLVSSQGGFFSLAILILASLLFMLILEIAVICKKSPEFLRSSDIILSFASRINKINWQQGFLRSFIGLTIAVALTPSIMTPFSSETMENVPQNLSGSDKARRIQRPNSAKAENCTQKCVGTCIRGGAGSPGEGPLNLGRPLVVFKEGFRSRQYCLVECSDICNLIGEGDDDP